MIGVTYNGQMYERIETTIKWPLDLDPITNLEFVDKVRRMYFKSHADRSVERSLTWNVGLSIWTQEAEKFVRYIC